MFGVAIGPPNVSGLPNPASSMRTMSTFGAPSGGCGPGIINQSGTDWSMVRPAVPPKVRSGIGSAVRSGLNLPAASASAAFSSAMPFLSIEATDLAGEPPRACSAGSRSSPSTMAMTTAVPGASLSPRPRSMPLSTLCLANFPTRAPAAAPTPAQALAAQVIAGLADAHFPVQVVLDQDHALRSDRLVLDQLHERVEVPLGRAGVLIGRHDYVEGAGEWLPVCRLVRRVSLPGDRNRVMSIGQ